MIKRDILEKRAKLIYIGIGSNLGNRRLNIERAKFALLQNDIRIFKSSSYYESLSWPDPKKPKFLNVIIEIFTNLNPENLMKLCKKIEIKLGRKKTSKNSPRECDIDIIDYNRKVKTNQIILPHPRMHNRNFVLMPLFEINKDWIHPSSKQNIKKLIQLLPNRDITSIKQI